MALAKVHTRRRPSAAKFVGIVLVLVALVSSVSFFAVTQAQGSGEIDSSVIGLGSSQASQNRLLDPSERIMANSQSQDSDQDASQSNDTDLLVVSDKKIDPSEGYQRAITVKDPDPVVVPVAIDNANPEAVKKAGEVCTLNPLPTAPHVAPDLNDGTWSRGVASAYCIATNDDGQGNFGVSTTASGRALSNGGITVAVPESQSYLLGHAVEICYDGKVVIATVTDTGGFARLGRALDLAPGVIEAFGYSSVSDWGTRSVSYRFL